MAIAQLPVDQKKGRDNCAAFEGLHARIRRAAVFEALVEQSGQRYHHFPLFVTVLMKSSFDGIVPVAHVTRQQGQDRFGRMRRLAKRLIGGSGFREPGRMLGRLDLPETILRNIQVAVDPLKVAGNRSFPRRAGGTDVAQERILQFVFVFAREHFQFRRE